MLPMTQLLDSHSTLAAKDAFDEVFFLESNTCSKQLLNGASGFAYFQVHYHLRSLKARYKFKAYQDRLMRLIALGRCPSKALNIWAEKWSHSQDSHPYYHPPHWQILRKLGTKAKEADIFITPEAFTNALVQLLIKGEGVLSRPKLIKLLPSMFRVEDDPEGTLWDDETIKALLELNHERTKAEILTASPHDQLGRPPQIDRIQRITIKKCFDCSYYAANYGHLLAFDEGVNGDDQVDCERLFKEFITEGRAKNQAPCEFFNYNYYIAKYWKSIPPEEDAYYYYLTKGWKLEHAPSQRFSHMFLESLTRSFEGKDECSPLEKILKYNYPSSLMLNSMVDAVEPTKSNYYTNCKLDPAGEPLVYKLLETTPAVHAFYLTQYHPVSENDSNWGKNFTEWSNASKALPYFIGHHQPKLPLEGFYDLRINENLHNQAKTAKEFGIEAFCFYFYWFQGKRILEKPLNSFLKNSCETQKFTVLWANENWTRNWDGQDDDIILSQSYGEDDCDRFCADIIPYLTHPRYFCVEGKPLLYIYRPSSIPNAYQWIAKLKNHFKSSQNRELLVGIVQYLPFDKLAGIYNADLVLQFPPNGFSKMALATPPPKIQREAINEHLILDYNSMIEENQSLEYPGEVIRTSFPAWDNSPRKKAGWATFLGADPTSFQAWVTNNLRSAKLDNSLGITMINAWNEWAEGASLEPDRLHGYEYLHAVRDARLHYALDVQCLKWRADHSKAIIAHVYYDDSVERVINKLKPYINMCDIYITTHPRGVTIRAAKILAHIPRARIFISANRGRDVRPFLALINTFHDLNIKYNYICKIHGKASQHRLDGLEWFNNVTEKLLPIDEHKQMDLLQFLDNHDVSKFGLLAPSGHMLNFKEYLGGNQFWTSKLQEYFASEEVSITPTVFIAGTMFWAGKSFCEKLVNHFTLDLFEEECGQLDETLAHSYERIFLCLSDYFGLCSYDSDFSRIKQADLGEIRYRYC
jgi:lipopolysaccharide biosynthesis protein